MIASKTRFILEFTINGTTRPLIDASASIAHDEIANLRRNDVTPCFQVSITGPGVAVTLATPGCPRSFGGRSPNNDERWFIQRWKDLGLNDPGFQARQAAQFLKDVLDYLDA